MCRLNKFVENLFVSDCVWFRLLMSNNCLCIVFLVLWFGLRFYFRMKIRKLGGLGRERGYGGRGFKWREKFGGFK